MKIFSTEFSNIAKTEDFYHTVSIDCNFYNCSVRQGRTGEEGHGLTRLGLSFVTLVTAPEACKGRITTQQSDPKKANAFFVRLARMSQLNSESLVRGHF